MIERPEGFEKEKNDCTVRAFALASGKSYAEVHKVFEENGRSSRHGILVRKVIQKVAKQLNVKAKQVKRHGSVAKLQRDFPNSKLFCTKRGHAFAVINGAISDWVSPQSHIKGAWEITQNENPNI